MKWSKFASNRLKKGTNHYVLRSCSFLILNKSPYMFESYYEIFFSKNIFFV